VRLQDEIIEHPLGDFEVGDHAILHWADGYNVSRRSPDHLFGFLAHGFDIARILVYGDNRWLIHHDPFALCEYQGVRRT